MLISSYVLFWIAAKQNISNLPIYWKTSLDITAGFSQAMSIEALNYWYIYVLAGALLIFGCIYELIVALKNKYIHYSEICNIMLILFFNITLFKYGFGRHDLHQIVYIGFNCLMFAAYQNMFRKMNAVKHDIKAGTILIVSFIGLYVSTVSVLNNYSYIDLLKYSSYDNITKNYTMLLECSFKSDEKKDIQMQVNINNAKLPRIQSVVKDSYVDIYNFETNYIWYNKLNYLPRPIFQSYQAYTDILMKYNVDKLYSEKKPEYILFKVQCIDGRMPLSDDALWVRHVLENYQYLFEEKGVMLFKAKTINEQNNTTDKKIKNIFVKWGEVIPIPNENNIYIKADIDYTLLGNIANILWKTPSIYAELTMNDDKKEYVRIIPKMIKEPMLISEFINSNELLIKHLQNKENKRVKSISFIKPWAGDFFMKSDFYIEVLDYE